MVAGPVSRYILVLFSEGCCFSNSFIWISPQEVICCSLICKSFSFFFFFFCIYKHPKWCDALDKIRYLILYSILQYFPILQDWVNCTLGVLAELVAFSIYTVCLLRLVLICSAILIMNENIVKHISIWSEKAGDTWTQVCFAGTFACSPCACVGFHRVLQLPPTVQRHFEVKWWFWIVCRCDRNVFGCLSLYI